VFATTINIDIHPEFLTEAAYQMIGTGWNSSWADCVLMWCSIQFLVLNQLSAYRAHCCYCSSCYCCCEWQIMQTCNLQNLTNNNHLLQNSFDCKISGPYSGTERHSQVFSFSWCSVV